MTYNLEKFLENIYIFLQKSADISSYVTSKGISLKLCFRTNQGTSAPSYMFLLRSEVSYIFFQMQITEQAKFVYSPLGKAFEKQTEKQVGAIKSLDLSNKKR